MNTNTNTNKTAANQIVCPNCGTIIKMDESNYAAIVQQVRNKEFAAELETRTEQIVNEQQAIFDLKLNEMAQQHEKDCHQKELTIRELQGKIDAASTEKELAVNRAIQEKEAEISRRDNDIVKLNGDLDKLAAQNEIELSRRDLEHNYEVERLNGEINRLKDFQLMQSTKMVGESLEVYCSNQFEMNRSMAFQTAYFDKDNDTKTGSKGDFIFRDYDNGIEYISIMFEMKNEMETTKSKHKNEDFFKELDKDRREKGCEYAVLVSMLESESQVYNAGIVDVSCKSGYEKMFVIRPQFFIPLISILRNAARASLQTRRELEEMKSERIDLTNFETNLNTFQKAFFQNWKHASDNYDSAIKRIDTVINTLTTLKEDLRKSERFLHVANNKLEGITIKELTKDAPSVLAQIEAGRALPSGAGATE